MSTTQIVFRSDFMELLVRQENPSCNKNYSFVTAAMLTVDPKMIIVPTTNIEFY